MESDLSSPSCGCDFVVATTEASINSGLREYLAEEDHPIQYICVMLDERGNPTVQISLDELKAKANGANPFEIPEKNRTPEQEKQLDDLADADFLVGIMFQMGLPPGVAPKDLDIVTLGSSADRVTFRMYCSQLKAVQLNATRRRVSLNVYSQPVGNPWSIETTVDLVVADLDKELDSSNYLKSHPEVRKALRDALRNFSGTAFSLQQLIFDLDNVILETVPKFHGVEEGSDAEYVLQRFFVNLYSATAKERGLPLVSVNVVPQPQEEGSVQITDMERIVCPLKDSLGKPIASPTREQAGVTTLNYLCTTNNKPVPRISGFDWNWVKPEQVDDISGVMAINRNIFWQNIVDSVLPSVKQFCLRPVISRNDGLALIADGTPTVKYRKDPKNPDDYPHHDDIHVEYSIDTNGWLSFPEAEKEAYVQMEVAYYFLVNVDEEGNKIKVYQEFRLTARTHFPEDEDPNNPGHWIKGVGITLAFRSLWERYSLSVDQNGALQLVKTDERPQEFQSDLDDPPPEDKDKNIYWQQFATMVRRHGIRATTFGNIEGVDIAKLHVFVFPGARVFTYKNPSFSTQGDLITEITYLDPVEVSPAQQSSAAARPMAAAHATSNPSQAGPAASAPTIPSSSGAGRRLTASTELMQNYVAGETVSPTSKFEALQTSDGHSLLFAIDSSGFFNVIEEQSGTSHTGWQVHALSTATTYRTVETFAVSQSVVDGSIGLMMAAGDQLFISLQNSCTDTSWVTKPAWKLVPFDAAGEDPPPFSITNTFFAESQDKKEYLIVDIQLGTGGFPRITRYHIDPSQANGYAWVKHNVAVDITTGSYQSCVGRVKNGFVDGIYTAGTTEDAAQFIYEPIINVWGNGPPAPRRLQLPGGAVPTSIATARNADGSTDLYAVGNSTLYHLPADKQTEHFEPLALFTDSLLAGTDTLRAMTHDGVTTLWGRNSSNQVYYLACPIEHLAQSDAWSAPIPLLSGVERISAYVNRADGGNTIFTASGDRVQKLTQASAAAGRLWSAHDITIASPPELKPLAFSSYTTTIHVLDENGLPVPKTTVHLTAKTRQPVYINGLYYVLSSKPITVDADATGVLTVVERVNGLNGTVLTISLDEETAITVNPMDHSIAKLTSLDSEEKLRNTQVTTKITAGGVVGSVEFTPLVPPLTRPEDVSAVANYLGLLKEKYISDDPVKHTAIQAVVQRNRGVVPGRMFRPGPPGVSQFSIWGDLGNLGHDIVSGNWGGAVNDVGDVANDVGDAVATSYGDLDHWLKDSARKLGDDMTDVWDGAKDLAKGLEDDAKHLVDGVKDAVGGLVDGLKDEVTILRDKATDTLHFMARIGGKAYRAALDTIEAVVGATKWVFRAIKTAAEDVLHFLQFLFEWDDIRRSKDVVHNVVKLWLHDQVDNIQLVQQVMDKTVTEVEKEMNSWANITDWSSGLGDVAKNSASSAIPNPPQQTSTSRFLADKYRDQARQLKILGDSPEIQVVENLLEVLITEIIKEGEVLGAVFTQLQELVSTFRSLSVEDILKRIATILADGILSSMQNVVDALLNVLSILAKAALDVLDTKIHIPIISSILKDIGVPELSFLDLFSWIAAVAVTVSYKTFQGHAPFPAKDVSVRAITSASTWNDLAAAFGQQTTVTLISGSSFASTAQHPAPAGPIAMPISVQKAVFEGFHICAGILSIIGNTLKGIEAEDQSSQKIISIPAAVLGLSGAACVAAADFLVPLHPVKSLPLKIFGWMTTSMVIACMAVFNGLSQWVFKKIKFAKKLVFQNARGLGAMLNGVLCIHGTVVTVWHFYELSQTPKDAKRDAAIIAEVANIASYMSRVAYAAAVNDEEQDSRLVSIIAMAAANDLFGSLQFAEAGVGVKGIS